jgi:hypothetical protein
MWPEAFRKPVVLPSGRAESRIIPEIDQRSGRIRMEERG